MYVHGRQMGLNGRLILLTASLSPCLVFLRKEEAKHKYRRRKGMISSRSKNTNWPLSHTAVPSNYVQKILSRTGPFYSLTGQHVGWKRLAQMKIIDVIANLFFWYLFIHLEYCLQGYFVPWVFYHPSSLAISFTLCWISPNTVVLKERWLRLLYLSSLILACWQLKWKGKK